MWWHQWQHQNRAPGQQGTQPPLQFKKLLPPSLHPTQHFGFLTPCSVLILAKGLQVQMSLFLQNCWWNALQTAKHTLPWEESHLRASLAFILYQTKHFLRWTWALLVTFSLYVIKGTFEMPCNECWTGQMCFPFPIWGEALMLELHLWRGVWRLLYLVITLAARSSLQHVLERILLHNTPKH